MTAEHRAGGAFRAGWWAAGLNRAEREAPAAADRPDWAAFVEHALGARDVGGEAAYATAGDRPAAVADGGAAGAPSARTAAGAAREPVGDEEWVPAFARPLQPLVDEVTRRIDGGTEHQRIGNTGAGEARRIEDVGAGEWRVRDVGAGEGRVRDAGAGERQIEEAGAGEVAGRVGDAGLGDVGGKAVDLDAVCADVAGWLSRRLARLAARAFVLEMHRAREAGRLRGATPEQRFEEFTRQLAADGALGGVLAAYPVLARLLGQACQRAVDATVELLQRLHADRAAIVAGLLDGIDPGALVGLELGRGDLHRGGRAVAFLRFAGGATVVYKPREPAAQLRFAELVAWLNGVVPGLRLRTPRCVAGTGYGWTDFVAPRPCTSPAQVGRFYRRQGALLALLYAVDGADMHHENVIACGGQPMLVDVETLFQPGMPVARAMPDPAAAALESSVLRVTLLPVLVFGRHGARDVSGLGGGDAVTDPVDRACWEAAGTDEMRLVRRPRALRGTDNRPRLHGRAADPAEHRDALLDGFRAAYDAIVRHRPSLVALLAACADAEIRVLARPTQRYATLLDESTHPDVLRDGLDRERVFDALRDDAGDETRRRLLAAEVADLWAGDVPLFTALPAATDVLASDGTRLPSLLPVAGLDAAATKIAAMGDVDRRQQEWLVTAALAARGRAVAHRAGEVAGRRAWEVCDPDRLLAAACCIADDLVASAVHAGGAAGFSAAGLTAGSTVGSAAVSPGSIAGRANWIGVEPADGRHWAVLPMGAGLAHGYSGVALFLAQLGALTGADRYTSLARDAVAPLPRLVEHLAAHPELAAAIGPGGFSGLGGICYALARLVRLTGDGELERCLAAAVDLAAGLRPGEDTSLDTGVAGGLAAATAVWRATGLPAARRLARRYADELVGGSTTGGTEAPAGFLHGTAGIGWALLRYARATRDDAGAESAGRELLATVPAIADPNVAWCTGLAGLALSEVGTGGTSNSGNTGGTAGLDRLAVALAGGPPLRDTSLCHGELGVVEALAILAGRGVEPAARALAQRTGEVLGAVDRHAHRCGTPDGVPTPGLLSGLAGIGYGLLRLGFPTEVPSVLMLDTEPRIPEPRNGE